MRTLAQKTPIFVQNKWKSTLKWKSGDVASPIYFLGLKFQHFLAMALKSKIMIIENFKIPTIFHPGVKYQIAWLWKTLKF